MTMVAFIGEITKAIGILLVQLTIEQKFSMTIFFVINSHAKYEALLGSNWIHSNWCIPCLMHQFLVCWRENNLEIIYVDNQLFSTTSNQVEAHHYHA